MKLQFTITAGCVAVITGSASYVFWHLAWAEQGELAAAGSALGGLRTQEAFESVFPSLGRGVRLLELDLFSDTDRSDLAWVQMNGLLWRRMIMSIWVILSGLVLVFAASKPRKRFLVWIRWAGLSTVGLCLIASAWLFSVSHTAKPDTLQEYMEAQRPNDSPARID